MPSSDEAAAASDLSRVPNPAPSMRVSEHRSKLPRRGFDGPVVFPNPTPVEGVSPPGKSGKLTVISSGPEEHSRLDGHDRLYSDIEHRKTSLFVVLSRSQSLQSALF